MRKKIILGLLSVALLVVPAIAAAQIDQYDTIGTTFGMGTADLESAVINIVQWVLGFLGLISIIFILYGGFVWMTAAGDEEKVSKAKKVIGAAVVGLIVILIAWAVVIFVIQQTKDVTT
jgi:amino acid transporter